MKIFVVNCGSSSIKYQLFDMADESVLAGGLLERVGTDEALLTHRVDASSHEARVRAGDHATGVGIILRTLTGGDGGVKTRPVPRSWGL